METATSSNNGSLSLAFVLGQANAKVREAYDLIEEAVGMEAAEAWTLDSLMPEKIGDKEYPGETSWRMHLGEKGKYSKDLFGILVSMLEGEPKNMVEGNGGQESQSLLWN